MKGRLLFVVAMTLTMSAGALIGQQQSALLAPDTIYHNGKVMTVDTPFTIAEAVGADARRRATPGYARRSTATLG